MLLRAAVLALLLRIRAARCWRCCFAPALVRFALMLALALALFEFAGSAGCCAVASRRAVLALLLRAARCAGAVASRQRWRWHLRRCWRLRWCWRFALMSNTAPARAERALAQPGLGVDFGLKRHSFCSAGR